MWNSNKCWNNLIFLSWLTTQYQKENGLLIFITFSQELFKKLPQVHRTKERWVILIKREHLIPTFHHHHHHHHLYHHLFSFHSNFPAQAVSKFVNQLLVIALKMATDLPSFIPFETQPSLKWKALGGQFSKQQDPNKIGRDYCS